MHITEHEIFLEQIKYAVEDIDVARELVRYIPIAKDNAIAWKAAAKLESELSEKGLKTLTKQFDMDHHAGTEYALKMALRSFRSDQIT